MREEKGAGREERKLYIKRRIVTSVLAKERVSNGRIRLHRDTRFISMFYIIFIHLCTSCFYHFILFSRYSFCYRRERKKVIQIFS